MDLKKRIITFFAVLVLAVLFLLPTVFGGWFKENWISKPIKLGLDLSGGVHLVYEVQSIEAVKSRLQATLTVIRSDLRKEKVAVTKAKVTDSNQIEITLLTSRSLDQAKKIISDSFRELNFERDESDGDRIKIIYGYKESQIKQIEFDAINQAVETLRNRVDQFGVAEPVIRRIGENRIMLQMPGVTDIDSVKKVVGSVAKLEFRLVPIGGGSGETLTLKDREGGPVTVDDEVLMTGDAVDSAQIATDMKIEVSLTLTSEGTRTFRKITSENVGRQLAIVLDGVVYSSPVINEPITGGRAVISGRFSVEEAKTLALVLRSGALPAPLIVAEERTVGPSLGAASIHKGVIAMVIGSIFIFVFMIVYYKKAGVVAVVSLALNLLFMVALLSAFGATLTLPGLAGLALTIGVAVDSNVLIFERIRDELRLGATRDAAVSVGFEKALSAIMDSNATHLIAGLILYYFGSGPIRGFAVTLCIGIITTLYCAVNVARLAFDRFSLSSNKGLSI